MRRRGLIDFGSGGRSSMEAHEKNLRPSDVIIRDLVSLGDFRQVEAIEREIWSLADIDVLPPTVAIALQESGNHWIGAFDRQKLVGFACGFFGVENQRLNIHSHMLGVLPKYQNGDLGYRLKLAQRERAFGVKVNLSADPKYGSLGIREITWTFDPLQSRNAHLNFTKLGAFSQRYKADLYGPDTSSPLHQNGTDRLWITWPIASRRVQKRLAGEDSRAATLDALSTLAPLIRFDADGAPVRTDLAASLARQRIAIEIPSDILGIEKENPTLAQDWRAATRWAFTEALNAGFFVTEFCRHVRGQQGPGVYLLEKLSSGDTQEFPR